MARRTDALGRYRNLLEVDPEGLEELLPRTREAPEGAVEALQPAEWERLTQILKHRMGGLHDPALRLLAMEHVGEIYEHQLGDLERAFRWWAQALTAHPFVDESCAELERLARTMDDWGRVVQVYSTAHKKLQPAAQRQVQLREARVHLEERGDASKAERIYRSLWQADRQNPELLSALEQFYVRVGREDELVNILRQRIEMAETVEERTDLRLRLGYLYEVERGEPDLAAECYRLVLKEDRLNRQALEALEQIYLRQERWLDLLSAYERMASSSSDDSERLDYLVRMARVCDDTTGDRARSREIWQQVRDLCGDDPALLGEMGARFEAMERWEELVDVLRRQARVEADPRARLRLYEAQGRILGDRLGDRQGAVARWRQVLEIEPDNVQALLALSELQGALEAWEELLATLGRLIEIAEREGNADLLGRLHAQVARVEAGRLGHSDEAVEHWTRVLELAPADARALDALEELHAAGGRWREQIEVLERKLELAAGDEQRVELLLRQAAAWRDGEGNAAAAAQALRRVLALDPAHEEAQAALCDLLRDTNQHEELVAQIFGWLETVEDPRRAVKLLQEAALVFEEQLGQPDKAFAVWQSALRQDWGNAVTASNLERLAADQGRFDELLAIYGEGVQSTQSAPIKVSLLVSMGRCVGLELGQVDRAVGLLHDALRMDPEAVSALEVLAECYRRAARWHELVPVLRRLAELEREGGRTVALLRELAQKLSRLGDTAGAMATYQRVLDIEPTNIEALSALEALYLASGMWAPLVGVLERQLELEVDDAARVVAIKRQVGAIWDQQLGDAQRAIRCYEEVLALEPEDTEAMGALQSLYDRTDQSEAYLEMVERLLRHTDDEEERGSMYPRIAAAWEEQFERPERAMVTLGQWLEVDPRAERAYIALERLCREVGDHARLVEVLRRHVDAVEETGEKVGLLLRLGEARDQLRKDPQQAIAAYEEVLGLDAEEVQALEALARLHERLEAFDRAAAALVRLVPLLSGPGRRDVLFRLGRINQDHLERIDQAEAFFEQALAVDPAHFDSMERLVELHRGRGDWARAAEMMIRAEPHTSNPAKKAQLLYDAGMLHLEQLGDEAQGVELLARTLAVDPDHLRAGLPLSEIYYRDGRWAELEPVLDMLSRKIDPRDKGTRQRVSFRLGRTSAELGKIDKAIRFYQEARNVDVTHLPTLQALAELQYRTESWGEAFKTYQTILVHHREKLELDQVVELFYRLGRVKEHQGERRKALNFYEKALEERPSHRGSLEAQIELQARQSNWEAVARAKTALLAVAGPDEQFELFRDLGRMQQEKLKNTDAAVEAYRAAVALRPSDRDLLTEFVELLTSHTTRWQEAQQLVLRLAELETHPEIRARFLYTAAVIARDELDQPDQALHIFGEALDAHPRHLKAFESIDRLCTARKDWAALERHYRRMIERLARAAGEEDRALLAMLWHNLGEVYRSRLKRLPDAVAAFEEAVSLEPGDMGRRVILAELYQLAGSTHAVKAIGVHETLIGADPLRLESYQALFRLHLAAGQPDSAWCVAGALICLKRADAAAQQLYEQHRRPSPRRARTRISEALWREAILDPRQDRRVDAVLAAIAPTLITLMARPAKDFSLKRKERVKPAAGQPMVDLFHHITSVLGGMPADLYHRRDQQQPMMVANTTESPSIVVSEELLSSPREKPLAFTLGQQLTYLRPAYYLCRLFPSPGHLRLVLLAALRLAQPRLAIRPEDAVEVDRLAQQMGEAVHAQPGLLQQLAALGQPLAAAAATLDLTPWWNHLGLTANRVGLIFCDDLDAAAQAIQSEPAIFGAMPASDKVRELVTYSVLPDYHRVRRELGISITK